MDNHDLLIEVANDVKNLKENVEQWRKDNKEEHNTLNRKLDCITDKKVSNRLFYWIMAIVVAVLIGSYGFTQVVSTSLTNHRLNTNVHTISK